MSRRRIGIKGAPQGQLKGLSHSTKIKREEASASESETLDFILRNNANLIIEGTPRRPTTLAKVLSYRNSSTRSGEGSAPK
ncbi:hypothetical protein B296_00013693 [Ensete ventricosum]|uniref:Uncharacterized protein n=1 Tax=Ensete ventricosum TaxID=4639 RepID=A0A427B1R7_ENSVE|nr:hypothetical protein B296_00013693 [Ensete ventricosum]